MLRNVSELLGRPVRGQDGEIGDIRDIYYDDANWKIRYLGVNAGRLWKKNILVSPVCITGPGWAARQFETGLTGRQVKESPGLDLSRPIARKDEIEVARFHGWPMYWDLGRAAPRPGVPGTGQVSATLVEEERLPGSLRSLQETTGYTLRTDDGAVGTVEEFIGEDSAWTIRYLVVNIGNWPRFKHVVLFTGWIDGINDAAREFATNISRTAIRHGPEYDPSVPLRRSYETRLFEYYGRPKYWR